MTRVEILDENSNLIAVYKAHEYASVEIHLVRKVK